MLGNPTDVEDAVTYKGQAFVIQGRLVFLRSGSIHYFRVPSQLWRDRLLQAKRAGLNCIETYVPWNFHETEEGVYNFDGDRDIGRFLSVCKDLGLYVFLRCGPYIDSEWDAGGYPAWLFGKPGFELRTINTIGWYYIRRWYEQLLPRVTVHQVTKNGPVIMVQSENEYHFVERPGGREYLQGLIRMLRELGIDVPITNCNRQPVPLQGSLTTLNTSDPNAVIPDYRKTNPNVPPFISEFWIGGLDFWGDSYLDSHPTLWIRQTMANMLLQRGMYNFYMFHGGTNFGFWASNSVRSDHSWITTEYNHTSPVAEGGALNDKYFAVKSASYLAANFQDFLCKSSVVPNPVIAEGPVRLHTLCSPQGVMLFVIPLYPVHDEIVWRVDGRAPFRSLVENPPSEEMAVQVGRLRFPSGEILDLAESSQSPLMLPYQFEIDQHCRVDFSNATMLGYTGTESSRVIVFCGEPGKLGIVSINDRRIEFVFSSDLVATRAGNVKLLALSPELADRAWFAEGRLVIGPAYVGESIEGQHECWVNERVTAIHTVSAEGKYRRMDVSAPTTQIGIIPISGWTEHVLEEIGGETKAWTDIGKPCSIETLGGYYGYAWYRASFVSKDARMGTVFFTHAADRIHVFLNGQRISGVWGRGEGATRDPLPISLAAGKNQFAFLCDNMGRSAEGGTLDFKGIWDEVYLDVKEQTLGGGEWSSDLLPLPSSESWKFKTYRKWYDGATVPHSFRFRATVVVGEDEGALLAFRWIPQYAWIYVNGMFVAEYGGDVGLAGGASFAEFILDPFIMGNRVQLDLTFFGEQDQNLDQRMRLFTYKKTFALNEWRFKPWESPTQRGESDGTLPRWWRCELPRPEIPGPLFLVTQGLSKGQAYLNGTALGRYWEIGPQHSLYLPEPYFQDSNTLAIFDEEGRRPDLVYIVRDPRCPIRKMLA